MTSRYVACGLKITLLVSATLLIVGCTTGNGGSPRVTPTRNSPRVVPTRIRPGPLTGARLSALIPTPAGFTVDPNTSYDSGTKKVVPVPGSSNASGFDCASWWSGKAHFGPGTIGYAVKSYIGPGHIAVRFDVNLYPAGTGAGVFAMSVAVQRRCRRFIYLDRDGQRYIVNAAIVPSARLGDRSLNVNATETAADGTVFTTQTTFIEVGDALVSVSETGSARAPLNRAALSLSAIVESLRSAGY